MRLEPFGLERFFARHEFAVRYNLAASDVEGLPLRELLALADDETTPLWEGLALGYTEPAGHEMLRTEIAALDAMDPANVVVCSGAEEAIFLTVHALVQPGDHVVALRPAYQSLHEVARAAGASLSLVDLQHEAGWRLDLAELQTALRPTTRAVIVNFPHNPTGAHLSAADLVALVAICEARGITLVSDEVYRFLEHDPRDTLPAAAALGERAVSIGVMSKAFALAGLRIGWVLCRDRSLLERIGALKDYTTICNAAPSEVLALIALRARAAVLQRSRGLVAASLARAREVIARHAPHLEWVEPRAGSVAFPRFRDERIDVDEFVEGFIARDQALLLPGSLFGYDRHFRLGLGRVAGPEGLDRLDGYLRHRLCDPLSS